MGCCEIQPWASAEGYLSCGTFLHYSSLSSPLDLIIILSSSMPHIQSQYGGNTYNLYRSQLFECCVEHRFFVISLSSSKFQMFPVQISVAMTAVDVCKQVCNFFQSLLANARIESCLLTVSYIALYQFVK